MTASLFDPISLGAIAAPNRIIMAPLTRGRAGPGFVPNELARDYYRQRASAGLIISEATGISQEGLGWPSASVRSSNPGTSCQSAGSKISLTPSIALMAATYLWECATPLEVLKGI